MFLVPSQISLQEDLELVIKRGDGKFGQHEPSSVENPSVPIHAFELVSLDEFIVMCVGSRVEDTGDVEDFDLGY